MSICENLHMNMSKFKDEFGCLPSTHVDASIKGWPINHVRWCILKELHVLCISVDVVKTKSYEHVLEYSY